MQCSSVGSALACFKAGQGSILFSARHPMEELHIEGTSDVENQGGLGCYQFMPESRNAGKKGKSGIGIFTIS